MDLSQRQRKAATTTIDHPAWTEDSGPNQQLRIIPPSSCSRLWQWYMNMPGSVGATAMRTRSPLEHKKRILISSVNQALAQVSRCAAAALQDPESNAVDVHGVRHRHAAEIVGKGPGRFFHEG
jgi:hypothetical protein